MTNLSERIIRSVIGAEAEGRRLDVYMADRFDYLSRHQWQELIKAGMITLNSKSVRNSRKLQNGDVICFQTDREEPEVDFNYRIIYQDEWLFIIDKSGNLPCHPAGPYFQNTLWHHLSQQFGKICIVNRLDRETSGILAAAKTSEMSSALVAEFAMERTRKTYIAAVYGRFDQEIDAEGLLVPDASSSILKKRRFTPGVKSPEHLPAAAKVETCRTILRPLQPGDRYSLVEAELKTGRMHQIRSTLFSLGFPLLGDKLYGPDDTVFLRFISDGMTVEDHKKLILPRQALHAARLEFVHPVTKQHLVFESPWPEDLKLPGRLGLQLN